MKTIKAEVRTNYTIVIDEKDILAFRDKYRDDLEHILDGKSELENAAFLRQFNKEIFSRSSFFSTFLAIFAGLDRIESIVYLGNDKYKIEGFTVGDILNDEKS